MIYFILYLIISVKTEDINIKTPKGVIIGEVHDGFNSFLGIPYARVDTNNLFGRSYNYENFMTPFVAKKADICCPQLIDSKYEGEIQCLTLNLYMPRTELSRLPVLVWLHSDGFWHGNISKYRSTHLVKEGIIFIVVNYRVGPYGYLCTQEPSMPGNQGLRDQVAALHWIQANIEAFKGDPSSVTIAGSGSGGAMVDLHLFSHLTDRLFDKAIIHSGSVFSYGFYQPPDSRFPISIAKYLGKSTGRHTRPIDVFPFLNSQNPAKIIEAAMFLNHTLGVCKEVSPGAGIANFITEGPFFLNAKDKVKHTKILIGYNSMEMLGLYANNNTDEFYEESGDIIYKILLNGFSFEKDKLDSVTYIIKKFYFGDKEYGPTRILNLAEAVSDLFINNGVEQSTNRFVDAGATVYKYLFSYTGASEYNHIKDSGAPQGEELKFLLDYDLGGNHENIRNTMVKMWANFIKYGNPTPYGTPVHWMPLHALSRPYLNISTSMEIMEDSFQRRNAFWHLFWNNYKQHSKVY